jgi:uncharacterized protein YggU (UPF0235/DUF167 family)
MQTQYLSVLVHPGSKKEVLVQTAPGRFEAWVRSKPIAGQANEALVTLLARSLAIPRERIRLVKGGFTRRKLFKVVG